jgi:hypothetical protein
MTTAYVRTRVAITTLLLATLAFAVRAQQADSTANLPFESFSFIQYATTDGPSPQSILRLDNNGEIVLSARRGITRKELEGEMHFTDSQIVLLKTFRLLEERNDTLTTAFPILGPEQTRQLRQRTEAAAPNLAERLAPEVHVLEKHLQAIGREGSGYTILFSYILDGLVWDEFEQRSLVDVREITAENPLWAGEVWALYPPRALDPGTNSISDEGVSLKVSWTDDAIPHMLPFVTDFPTLIQMFDDYKTAGVVEHEHVRGVFGPFDLFDSEGHFTVPIIVEEDSNALYRSARAITEEITAEAPQLLKLTTLVDKFGFDNEKQALVVSYHELMWDVMNSLEAAGLVRVPVAFAEPDRAKSSDIADLVFIVRASR